MEIEANQKCLVAENKHLVFDESTLQGGDVGRSKWLCNFEPSYFCANILTAGNNFYNHAFTTLLLVGRATLVLQNCPWIRRFQRRLCHLPPLQRCLQLFEQDV